MNHGGSDEKFIISAITRGGIAEDLNECAVDYMDGQEDKYVYDPLKPNDARLTSTICQEYADKIYELTLDGTEDQQDVAVTEYQYDLCVKLKVFIAK